MEFTKSLFERRLTHILTAVAGEESGSVSGRMHRWPVAFRFSRKYRREAKDAPKGLSRIAAAEVDGHVLWAPASDWKLVCYYLMSGGLDPGLARFFRKNVGPGAVFFDIGACLGAYSILAAILTGGDGVVHSFEAAPEAFGWLTRNLDETGLAIGSRIRPSAVNAPLDDLVSPGERVDFIRIGGHYPISDVLRGMQRVSGENPQCRIVVEYCAALHPRGAKLISLVEEIDAMGFSIRRVDGAGEIVPLLRDELDGGFSASLLLERRETRWSG